jgi:endoribonuclease Dicer
MSWVQLGFKLTFDRRTWYPEELTLLTGKGASNAKEDAPATHTLSDKTMADVCEALIGAAYLSSPNSKDYDQAVKAVTIFVDNSDHTQLCWADYYKQYEMPNYQIAASSASVLDLAAKVEKLHPYHFKYPRLLQSAFVHSSYPRIQINVPDYQRLEFLGDSLIDMCTVNYLFDKFPDKDPQWLTEHKVSTINLQIPNSIIHY